MKLIALGAFLVGDDRCLLIGDERGITVERPPNLPMGIEARGIGILRAPMKDNARLGLIVDLGQKETERLPEQRTPRSWGMIFRCFMITNWTHLRKVCISLPGTGLSKTYRGLHV